MFALKYAVMIVGICSVLFASSPEISITGTVTDGSNPVEGVVITLVNVEGISDTTGADGVFELSNVTGINVPNNLQSERNAVIGINRSMLSVSLSRDVDNGSVAFFSGNGRKVAVIPLNDLSAGKHNVPIPALSSGFYLLNVMIGNTVVTRKIIVTGSGVYLNGSAGMKETAGISVFAKTMQDEVDQIKAEKEGYATATVGIDSYQKTDVGIVLEEECAGPCCGGKLATTDVTQKGPFETVSENVTGAILVRPKELIDGCLYPVVTWGHGAMGSPNDYTNLITILASHGFIVVGSTAGNVQDGGNTSNQFRNKMVEVAEWVVEQNDNASSELYQKIATDKIGAAGHSQGGYGATEAGQNPLIATSVSSCGAVGSTNLQGPALILCGGQDNNSGAQCSDHPEDAYNGINNVPVMKAEFHSADHGWSMDFMGSSDPDNPHGMLMAMTAWFRYHLMGDEEYKSWFYGSDCYLCDHENWTVKSKNMD